MFKHNPIDSLISLISPTWGLRRESARKELEAMRKYAAAKDAHWTGFQNMGNTSGNSEVGSSWGTITSRAQQLVRDFPPFTAAINNIEAFLVGDGIRFQSLALKPNGEADTELSSVLEEAFLQWGEGECDQMGAMTYTEMLSMAVRSQYETGDAIFMEVFEPRSKSHSFRILDPIKLTGDLGLRNPANNNPMWFGIEYDELSMRKRAYHFDRDVDWGTSYLEPIRIPADRIIHGYKVTRPDQLRGVSAFASSILLAHSVRDYIQAELATQQAHSKWTGFVTTPSTGSMGSRVPGQSADWTKAEWDATQRKWLEKLEYASIEMLKPGENITLNTTTRSTQGLDGFTATILRMVSAANGVPYEILSQDYRQLNYTTLRAIRNDFKQNLRPRWASLIAHFCRPMFQKWLDKQVLMGQLKIPDYWDRRTQIQRGLWIPPGMESVDPLKEAKANIELMKAGIASPQEVIMTRGSDPDRVLKNMSEWKKRLESEGLLDLWQTNNPLSVVDNEDSQNQSDTNQEDDEDAE